LDPAIFKRTKIFEKAEMRWFTIDEMMRHKKAFRSYFQNIVDIMYAQRREIAAFIGRRMQHSSGVSGVTKKHVRVRARTHRAHSKKHRHRHRHHKHRDIL
jgi:protein associated with RNAse G/E